MVVPGRPYTVRQQMLGKFRRVYRTRARRGRARDVVSKLCAERRIHGCAVTFRARPKIRIPVHPSSYRNRCGNCVSRMTETRSSRREPARHELPLHDGPRPDAQVTRLGSRPRGAPGIRTRRVLVPADFGASRRTFRHPPTAAPRERRRRDESEPRRRRPRTGCAGSPRRPPTR